MKQNNKVTVLDGNACAVEAIKLAKVQVVAAYPITPQSSIAEKLSEIIEKGELKAKYIRVESEHSALSCVIGAQLTGIRAMTATSSVGLAYMNEVLGVASGCRLPIVMPVVNRALVSPWSLWCDHQDSMSAKDAGWLQLYAENPQEVLDLVIIAYKIAENINVQLPIMVCFDGFFVSHSLQRIELLNQELVNIYLKEYTPYNFILDIKNPMFINTLTGPDEFSEMRYQQKIGFENALKIIPQSCNEFASIFGRKYDLLEEFNLDNANIILISNGSISGTIKYVIEKLNKKVGLLKLISFRPFPSERIQKILKNKKTIAVIERCPIMGSKGGPIWTEIRAILDHTTIVNDYIVGLGGRDVTCETIINIIDNLQKISCNQLKDTVEYIDTDIINAIELRTKKI